MCNDVLWVGMMLFEQQSPREATELSNILAITLHLCICGWVRAASMGTLHAHTLPRS